MVPKCRKCFGPTDTLFDIAALYNGQWLDLWSVNSNLVNTTKANAATDEVFNSPADQAYPLVPLGASVRLGVAYRIGGGDTLLTVARRFGMRMVDLMVLDRPPQTPNTRPPSLNTQHSTLNTQHSILNNQYSILNSQHSNLHPQH